MAVKACDTETFKAACVSADYLNRGPTPGLLDRLDPSATHVLSVLMVHEHAAGTMVGPHYRCQALVMLDSSREPVEIIVDLHIDDVEAMDNAADLVRQMAEAKAEWTSDGRRTAVDA